MNARSRRLAGAVLAALALPGLADAPTAGAGAFVFAGEANGVDVVTHPTGYTGSGGTLPVTVCIDPTSANAAAMEIPVRNIVHTWNTRTPVTGNLLLGGSNDIPSNGVDFESTVLHELGHCIGLAHPNLATESGLGDPEANGTKSTDGANNGFDVASGSDGTFGSSDDARGDDVNLHWFRISNNDPFTIDSPVDSTTYSRDLADLPPGHAFAANGDRSVASLLGVPNTEAVMQQGAYTDEDQRQLTHDDVATLEYAMSGLDETAGTSDDYTLELSYGGLSSSCDVVLDFDDTETGFAVCVTGGSLISGGPHVRITSADIYLNTGYNWYFNDELSAPLSPAFQESQTGTASNATGVTSGTLTAAADHLYLASISTRPDLAVTSVSGLGLSWTPVASQCSGGGDTGVAVWQAIGSPSGDGAVTASFASSADRSTIAVTRYSEVRGSGAVANVVKGNAHGLDGSCSGAADGSAYSFDVTTTGAASRAFGAVAKNNRTHSPGAGYTERADVRTGSSPSSAGVAVEDRPVASPSTSAIDGSFNSGTDWAFVGFEIAAPECVSDGDCDDGLFCNGTETCTAGGCQAGTPVVCDDGVSCTLDTCNEATDQCDVTPDDAACDDALFCNGAETCDPVQDCQTGTPVVCDDGVSCTLDACNETADQCDVTPDDGLCDDANPCTTNHCDALAGCQSEPSGACTASVPAGGPWQRVALALLVLYAGALVADALRRRRA